MERLKRRMDFRAAAQAMRAPGRTFVLQARQRPDDGDVRVGFTVSRQVGNSVERNRVKRRLRELVRLADTESLRSNHDYVLIGRRAALTSPFGEMKKELVAALARIRASRPQPAGDPGKSPLHEAGSPSFKPPSFKPQSVKSPRPSDRRRKARQDRPMAED
jgi:ribonuclease P protein component